MNAHPPGWHGKLPSLGDFASRRLDPGFVEAWDGWLAAGLLALREGHAETWLQAYLDSPIWRFLLMPGVLPGEAGKGAWAGVLMPSVDRVGRYFPFTIAQPLGDAPSSTQQMRNLWYWLGLLDELAGDALQDDWSVDRLETELARMAPPEVEPFDAPVLHPPGLPGALVTLEFDVATAIGCEAQALWRAQAAGRAYWFASNGVVGQRMLVSRGLPAPTQMRALLGATI